jgi:hypothetical protein
MARFRFRGVWRDFELYQTGEGEWHAPKQADAIVMMNFKA